MPDDAGNAAAAQSSDETVSYVDALAELEQILDELDGDDVDVDVLGARVERAAQLLRLCRDRISGARLQVERVVAELDAEAEAISASRQPDQPNNDDDTG